MTRPGAWTQTGPGGSGRDPKLRAGDRDRDAVAELLRAQHAEGRLDTEELQDRINRCYDARTLGGLERLIADLPRGPRADDGLGWRRGPWPLRLMALAPVLVALAAISALSGRHVIWLAVPLIFLTVRLTAPRQKPWRSPGPSLPEGHRQ